MSYASFKTRYVEDPSTNRDIENFAALNIANAISSVGNQFKMMNIADIFGKPNTNAKGEGVGVVYNVGKPNTNAKGEGVGIANTIGGIGQAFQQKSDKNNDAVMILSNPKGVNSTQSIANAIGGGILKIADNVAKSNTNAKGVVIDSVVSAVGNGVNKMNAIGNVGISTQTSIDLSKIKRAIDNLNKLPVNARNINMLPQVFEGNMSEMNINGSIARGGQSNNLTISGIDQLSDTKQGIGAQYSKFIMKNFIVDTIKTSNNNIQASIIHCEFDNVALSGQYTVELNLLKSQGYNADYAGLIRMMIPPAAHQYWENRQNFNEVLNLEQYPMGKIIVIVNSTFKQLTLLNPKKFPIIFVNCVGRVNIVYKTDPAIINFLRPPCAKLNCPEAKCPSCPKQICPSCPKQQECPKQKFQMCPSCPKQQACPVCSADDDDEDY